MNIDGLTVPYDAVLRFEFGPKIVRDRSIDLPAPTIMAIGINNVREHQASIDTVGRGALNDPETGATLIPYKSRPLPGRRKLTLVELRRLCGFPDDFALTGDYLQRWERLGRAVPPVMAALIASALRDEVLTQGGSPMGIVGVGSYSPPAGQRGNRHLPAWQSPDRPAPTIGVEFRREVGGTGCLLTDDQPERLAQMTDKPPYRVPSMVDIVAVEGTGLTAASTFSGCGGSSLGYRMAGFRVLWASEFVPAARETYLANAAPYTVVDDRDIRDVSAEDMLAALGMAVGELDLLDGSPPCASFSTAGKRHEGWGKVKSYSDTAQRTDDLFYEYARLVRGIQPRVFVAENVSGLVKGTAKGYFIRIMTELRSCGYRVAAKLLDAQWLGVPQARQRLIIIGVRNDLRRDPVFPRPLPYRYSVREALPWVLQQGDNGGFGQGAMRPADASGTIGADPSSGNGRFPPSAVTVVTKRGARSAGLPAPTVQTHGRPFTESELSIITLDRSDGSRISDGDDPSPAVTASGIGRAHGNREVALRTPVPATTDPETGKDLRIAKYAIGRECERLARTDLTVARKFTLGELRRICGFPDDFVLTGTYEQRWERLGRAVPPVMMAAIAAAVRDRVLLPARASA